jgi:hypothetical protein
VVENCLRWWREGEWMTRLMVQAEVLVARLGQLLADA